MLTLSSFFSEQQYFVHKLEFYTLPEGLLGFWALSKMVHHFGCLQNTEGTFSPIRLSVASYKNIFYPSCNKSYKSLHRYHTTWCAHPWKVNCNYHHCLHHPSYKHLEKVEVWGKLCTMLFAFWLGQHTQERPHHLVGALSWASIQQLGLDIELEVIWLKE